MKNTVFDIKGMHCKSCAALINDALTDHKGVKDSSVDEKKNTAKVSFDEKVTNEKQLIQVIENEGYKATIKHK
jgi:copper chaperone CopZ